MCIDACAWKKRFAPERSCCVCLDARGGGGAWERLVGSGQDTEDYKAKGREAAVANAMEWRARGKPHRHRLQRALERWHLASSVMKQGGGMRGVRKRGGCILLGACGCVRNHATAQRASPATTHTLLELYVSHAPSLGRAKGHTAPRLLGLPAASRPPTAWPRPLGRLSDSGNLLTLAPCNNAQKC